MKTPQFLNRALRVLAALALAFAIPACGDEDNSGSPSSPGAGVNTPLIWSGSANTGGTGDTSTTSANGDTPLIWTDPNSFPNYVPVGIGGAVRYTDVRTYSAPNAYVSTNSMFATHPLRTQTSSNNITVPEDNLAGAINSYRQTAYGGGGGIGGGGIGGGGGVGNLAGVLLPMHTTNREANRAHCHHYSGFLPAATFVYRNEEGDWLATVNIADIRTVGQYGFIPPLAFQAMDAVPGPVGVLEYPNGVPVMTTADRGRLGKNGIRIGRINPFNWSDHIFSGTVWDDYILIYDEFLADPILYQYMAVAPGYWTHMGVGFWIGGPQTYYWEVSFLFNPTPQN